MKKFTFLAIFLIAMVSMALAQTNMFVWMDGIKTTYPIALVDSVTFGDDEAPIGGIGVFSVGEGKTVTFSPGNLQYTQSTNTWSFAENQWDDIGTDNVTGGSVSSDQYGDSKYGDALADKIDLFGWSTVATNFGVSTSTSNSDYSGSFVDWGTNKIGSDAPNTWRTLSYDEWYYLRYNRTNADNLVGVAQVNGVNGLIFLPDNWTCPSGVTFKSGFHSNYGVDDYAAYQTFTADQWSKLEAAGAVFLPAAGYRYGSDVYGVQYRGRYWSATGNTSDIAHCLSFTSGAAYMYGHGRVSGPSVRLVKDISNTTPEPPVEPETEWITIYIDTVICEYDLPFNWHVGDHTMILCETAGTYTHEEIVEVENYIYHHIYTLELTVIPFSSDTIVVEAYDSYEWHGEVYTESGVHKYEEWCYQEILHLTIIDTPTPSEPQDTTIYHPVDITICENDLPYIFTGRESVIELTEAGTYTYEEIVEEDNYIYHFIYTLELTVLDDVSISVAPETVTICASELPYFWVVDGEYGQYWVECDAAGSYQYIESLECGVATYILELEVLEEGIFDTIWVEAYDSYEWHGKVYTESGQYHYYNDCSSVEVLNLTIIKTPTKPEGDNCENAIQVNWNDEISICGSTDTWYAIDISGIWERGEDITTTFRNNSAETATITNASYLVCYEDIVDNEIPLTEAKSEVKSGEERTIVYDFYKLLDFRVYIPDDIIYLHIKNDGGCVTAPALWFWLPATEDFVE